MPEGQIYTFPHSGLGPDEDGRVVWKGNDPQPIREDRVEDRMLIAAYSVDKETRSALHQDAKLVELAASDAVASLRSKDTDKGV